MAHSNAWCSISAVYYMSHWCRQEEHPAKIVPVHKKVTIEGLRERTEHLDIFLFFRQALNGVLFPMFCLLVEEECQILVF